MSAPTQIIHEFVLAHLPDEPLAKQVELYRALAAHAATRVERDELTALANECEALIRRHHQLTLDFQRRAEG